MTSDHAAAPSGVLAKAVAILHAFTVDDHGLRFAELQRRTGLAKPTLHRILAQMVELGLVQVDDGDYRLGQDVFELGMRASLERALVETAMPYLEDLYQRAHVLVHLGVRTGTEVTYLTKISGHEKVASPSRLGGRMPLHATAIGKSLLAFGDSELVRQILVGHLPRLTPHTIATAGGLRRELDRVRQRGASFEYEESAPGIACVAAPVSDPSGRAVAAISLTGRLPAFVPGRHVRALRVAARGIGADLAQRPDVHWAIESS